LRNRWRAAQQRSLSGRAGGIGGSKAGLSVAEFERAGRWNSRIDGGSLSSRVLSGQAGGIAESMAGCSAAGVRRTGRWDSRIGGGRFRRRNTVVGRHNCPLACLAVEATGGEGLIIDLWER
jgi:hypothetical protein